MAQHSVSANSKCQKKDVNQRAPTPPIEHLGALSGFSTFH